MLIGAERWVFPPSPGSAHWAAHTLAGAARTQSTRRSETLRRIPRESCVSWKRRDAVHPHQHTDPTGVYETWMSTRRLSLWCITGLYTRKLLCNSPTCALCVFVVSVSVACYYCLCESGLKMRKLNVAFVIVWAVMSIYLWTFKPKWKGTNVFTNSISSIHRSPPQIQENYILGNSADKCFRNE